MINEYTMTTELYKVDEFRRETTELKLDPAMSDWRDLVADTISCQRRTKIDFFVQYDPKRREFWLHGASSAIEQHDSLTMRGAVRQGYFGPHHVVCILESLREHSSLWVEEREEPLEPLEPLKRRTVKFSGFDCGVFSLPRRTGLLCIESVFSAEVDLFMKYEALREVALASTIQRAGLSALPAGEKGASINEIKAEINKAVAERNLTKAVELDLDLQRAHGRAPSKAALYSAIGMDHSYFYKSVKRAKPGSTPYASISHALLESAWLHPKKTKQRLTNEI